MNMQQQRWYLFPAGNLGTESQGAMRSRNEEAVRHLNTLLRGEIAASETYRMGIDKLISDGIDTVRVSILRELQHDHLRAGQIFRRRVKELGGIAEETSGGWGAWTKIAMGTAQIFGDSAALHALRDGEEHGLKEMRHALDNLDADSAELVEKAMIPAQARHIGRINSLIDLFSA
jgi:Domain of unknown function (DUF2383)